MKTKQQVFDMLDKFMDTDPKSTEVDSIILALDWVLGRVDTEDLYIEPDQQWIG